MDIALEANDGSDTDTDTDGREGKFHLDYFGIAGCAYCLLFGQYIEVTTTKSRWTIKGQLRRWWQVKVSQIYGIKEGLRSRFDSSGVERVL